MQAHERKIYTVGENYVNDAVAEYCQKAAEFLSEANRAYDFTSD